MPYRRKDSPVWWATYTDASGKRVRRSTGTENRKEAEALEAKWKLEAHQQSKWGEQPSRLFEEVMAEYLKATRARKRSHKTDLCRARVLRAAFSGVEMRSITAADITKYRQKRCQSGVCDATVNREIALLSSAINYARRSLNWDVPNVTRGLKERESEGRVRWISHSEAEALLRAAVETRSSVLPDFIRLALHTGCRKGELLGLEWRRVDLQRRLIHLGGQHTKSGKRRSIPLNVEARTALMNRRRFQAAHCPGSQWVFCNKRGQRVKDVKRAFATACSLAGIADFRMHDLRHTFAAWLVSEGVPLSEVRDLLGHASVTMTERYAHLAPGRLRDAVEVLTGSVSRSRHAGKMQGVRRADGVA